MRVKGKRAQLWLIFAFFVLFGLDRFEYTFGQFLLRNGSIFVRVLLDQRRECSHAIHLARWRLEEDVARVEKNMSLL